MAKINVAEFAPDLPKNNGLASDNIRNVMPVSDVAYKPMRQFTEYSTALTARCQGGISAQDDSGNVAVFMGDATKLYRLAAGSTTPANVSKAGVYATSSEGYWSFSAFGKRVIATNYNDAPQTYLESVDVLFSDLITSGLTTLKAKHCAIAKNFLIMGNTVDGTYGTNPQRIHWSAVGDPRNFPMPGTTAAANALSDYRDLFGDHGEVMKVVGDLGNADFAVFMERAVFRATYSGLPKVFTTSLIQGARGALCSNGVVAFGGVCYYIGEDGFYSFDGANSKPIGAFKINEYFLTDMDSSYTHTISSTVDVKNGVIIWAYAGTGHSGGTPNKLIIYCPRSDRFTTTVAGTYSIEWLIKGVTFGYTLEQLDAFGTIDSLPASLDSQMWKGGNYLLAGVNSSHKFGYFSGNSAAAYIETQVFQPIEGRRTLIPRVEPIIDTDDYTLQHGTKESVSGAITYSPQKTPEYDGTVSLDESAYYHSILISIPAASSWTKFSGISGINAVDMGDY